MRQVSRMLLRNPGGMIGTVLARRANQIEACVEPEYTALS